MIPQDLPASLKDITEKRVKSAKRDGFVPQEVHTCPETGAGTLIGTQRWGDPQKVIARHYRARSYKTAFHTEEVQSNHQRLRMAHGARVKVILNAKKEAKKLPHDLKVGEIISRTWGVTMQGADFYKVVDIPAPRKVALVPLSSRQVSGDWMGGTVEPIDEEIKDPTAGRLVYDVDMSSGEARILTKSSIERMGRWGGKPVSIWSD